MNDRLNRAVERLLLDDRLIRRFRRNPGRALKPFGLTSEEVEAVKQGDAQKLVGLGLDPSYVWPKPKQEGFLPAWIVRHAKVLSPVFVLAALLLPAAPAVAAKPGARRAMRIAGARARYRAPQMRIAQARIAARHLGAKRAVRAMGLVRAARAGRAARAL